MTAAADGLRKNRIPIMMSVDELKAIDDWRFERRIGSRADAIRQLCTIGLTDCWMGLKTAAAYNLQGQLDPANFVQLLNEPQG